MGCASSSQAHGGVDPEMARRNKEIEAQLAKDKEQYESTLKMLILGTGESGKSTVMKQMTILHGGGFTKHDRVEYVEIMFSNTIQSMQAVLEALSTLEVDIHPANAEARAVVLATDAHERVSDLRLLDALQRLYDDPAIRACLAVKNRFQINDSADYFFQEVARTMHPNYVPTDQDIIRARVRTTGIQERTFMLGKQRLRMFDMGGQRAERRKWISVFDGCNVLLFLVAISEYDQTLYEDETQSRMSEALIVFDQVVNSRWFAKSTLILFLNKVDLFKAKLARSSLRQAFPNYAGDDNDYSAASQFILQQFKQLYRHPSKRLYHHFTNATDTRGLEVVMASVQDQILHETLQATGLMM
ncbi:guanine nucleotide-binding protein subunit alpha [Microbotryomycetes sp. JL221]|nr:guanine nucleotide-binding protein subunit alpha [Microbotryomycetes sp. JL221]